MKASEEAAEYAKSYEKADIKRIPNISKLKRARRLHEKGDHNGDVASAIMDAVRFHVLPSEIHEFENAMKIHRLQQEIAQIKAESARRQEQIENWRNAYFAEVEKHELPSDDYDEDYD